MSGSTSSVVVMEEASRLYEMTKEAAALKEKWSALQRDVFIELATSEPDIDTETRKYRANQLAHERAPELARSFDDLDAEIYALQTKHAAIIAAGWAGQHERDSYFNNRLKDLAETESAK